MLHAITITKATRPRPALWSALLATLLVTSSARADDSEACKRARDVMGADARRATAQECQRQLDIAEEDQWQLWLDLALASEQTGDSEDAVAAYQRFIDGADKRGERLADAWPRLRDEARTAVGRLDTELLQKRARVSLSSIPDGAVVTIVAGGAQVRADSERTPAVRYFPPGAHTVRFVSKDTEESREIRFSVEAGQTLELKIDLRPGAPTEHGIIEGTGPALRGQKPGLGTPGTPGTGDGAGKVSVEIEGPGRPGVVDAELPEDPDDGEPPPQTRTVRSPMKTIGVAATALGVAALAVGAVFLTTGVGIDDELDACARPGSGCSGTAAELNQLAREGDVAYDRATAAFITGGVLVVGGVVTMLLFGDDTTVDAPDRSHSPSGPVRVTPYVSPDGAGVSTMLVF